MKPIVVINFFQLKPGKLDEFIEVQQAFAKELSQIFKGLQGGRMHKGADGKSAVLISLFESMKAQEEVRQLEAFKKHVSRLQLLIESANPGLYEIAYTVGQFE